jgi:hypothetical protein
MKVFRDLVLFVLSVRKWLSSSEVRRNRVFRFFVGFFSVAMFLFGAFIALCIGFLLIAFLNNQSEFNIGCFVILMICLLGGVFNVFYFDE